MITNAPKKRAPGRPAVPPADRKSAFLRFRTREGLAEKLEAAAAASGRAVSEEVERRLDDSFRMAEIVSAASGQAASSVLSYWINFNRSAVGGEFNQSVGSQFAYIFNNEMRQHIVDGLEPEQLFRAAKKVLQERGDAMLGALLTTMPYPPVAGKHPLDVEREAEIERTRILHERSVMRPKQGQKDTD